MNDKRTGQRYWQSLNELADTPAVRAAIENEFPGYEPGSMLSQSRRGFLKLAGASMALAGLTLTGCRRWPRETLVPHTSRPQGRIPGKSESYATVMELGGFAQPLLITTYDGRPIKIEGNPLHPMSATFGGKLGATTLISQASVLEMYDPERSRAIIHRTNRGREAVSRAAFTQALASEAAKLKNNGAGLAILIEETRSPTVHDMIGRTLQAFPGAKVYEYEALARTNQTQADQQSFGQPVRQLFDLKKADIIVSFDADLLGVHPAVLRYGNDWAAKRKGVDAEKFEDKSMNRMYVIESMYSTTGSVADERFPSTISRIEAMVLQLANRVLGQSGVPLDEHENEIVDRMFNDLQQANGNVVIAGGVHLRPEVLSVINAMNARLGAYGKTITLVPDADRPGKNQSLKALVDAMNGGAVQTLLILGGNPVYDAPTDLNFPGALTKVTTSMHLSVYDNETSEACNWHVNRAHYLESWGDSEAYDGTVSIQQPTILPLFDGLTIPSFLASLLGETPASVLGISEEQARDITLDQAVLYRQWSARLNERFVANSPKFREALHDGFFKGSAKTVQAGGNITAPPVDFPSNAKGFEVRLVQDYKIYDGRFANNGWLQECPDPITKTCWDNCAQLSYADAKELGVEQSEYETDLLEVTLNGRTLKIPAYIMPGQPKGVVTIALGYGRKKVGGIVLTDLPGSIGSGVGYDSYQLRATDTMWFGRGGQIKMTGERVALASYQTLHLIEPMGVSIRADRVGEKSQPGKIVQETTLKAFVESKGKAQRAATHTMIPLQLWPEPYTTPKKHEDGRSAFNEPHAWGMAVDMNTCIGCHACVVACQSENNIPVVGKDQIMQNRDMLWLRIDRYFKATGETADEIVSDPNPQITFQPMLCVHCENAPCEQVCPVAATVHDSEGLNTMVYNRCIGTRYCSNNCPYKVRRFNYHDYQSKHPRESYFPWLGIPDTQQEHEVDKIKRMVFNPDVTVRMRGVMEKCTYCTQRIKEVTIQRRNEWVNGQRQKPTVDDFDVVTACQQACPTEAIVFGDLNDPNSLVSKLHKNHRSYAVLQELNNRPRTHHMAKLRNPAVEPVASKKNHH